jgi:hypothetical protein
MARLGHKITLATIWESEAERDFLNGLSAEGIEIIAKPQTKIQSITNLLHTLISGRPLQSEYSWQPRLSQLIAKQLIKPYNDYDIIHIEHLRGAIFGLAINGDTEGVRSRIPIVWDSVDNIS